MFGGVSKDDAKIQTRNHNYINVVRKSHVSYSSLKPEHEADIECIL